MWALIVIAIVAGLATVTAVVTVALIMDQGEAVSSRTLGPR
jgi:hypothetical protein